MVFITREVKRKERESNSWRRKSEIGWRLRRRGKRSRGRGVHRNGTRLKGRQEATYKREKMEVKR
jgi:hypothetical protein